MFQDVYVSSRYAIDEGGLYGTTRKVASVIGVLGRVRVIYVRVRSGASLQRGTRGTIYMFTNFYSGDLEVTCTSISTSDEGGASRASNQIAISYGGGIECREYHNYFSVDSKGNGEDVVVPRSLSRGLYAYRR